MTIWLETFENDILSKLNIIEIAFRTKQGKISKGKNEIWNISDQIVTMLIV